MRPFNISMCVFNIGMALLWWVRLFREWTDTYAISAICFTIAAAIHGYAAVRYK